MLYGMNAHTALFGEVIYQTYASTNGMIGVTFESKSNVSHSTER